MSPTREIEAAGIFATHGVLDAVTTALAAVHISAHGEGNPLMRALLREGVGFAAGSMLFVVGLLAAAWPHVADRYDFPKWFAPLLCAVGLAVAAGNVWVVVR